MKTIFPDEIPEEMEELREEADSIDESLKPILDSDEKLRKLTETTSSALSKITASSSMLSAFQGYRINPIFRDFGGLALSSAIPKYSFTNPVLRQIKENRALNMSGMRFLQRTSSVSVPLLWKISGMSFLKLTKWMSSMPV